MTIVHHWSACKYNNMQTWILCFFVIDILIYTTLNGRNYSKHFFRSGKQQKYSILNWISETQSSKALLPWHIALGFKVPNAVMQFSLGFFSWVFLLIKRGFQRSCRSKSQTFSWSFWCAKSYSKTRSSI